VKPLCKSTELNRCIDTDRRWKSKQVSCSSPERLRPISLRNSKDYYYYYYYYYKITGVMATYKMIETDLSGDGLLCDSPDDL